MKPHSPQHFPPIIYVFFAVLLWSTGGLLIKLTTLDSFSVNCGRSLFAAIVVAIFTYKKGLRPDAFTILTSILYAGTLSCFVYATKNTTAANAIFLQYTAPIYILILAPFVLREKFHISDLVTVILCIGGMSLFFFDTKQTETAPNVYLGNIVALVSGVFFGLYILFLRHPRSLCKNPAVSVFYGNIIVVLLTAPFIFSHPPASITGTDISAILFLGIFQIGLSYMLFTTGMAAGVRSLDASIVGFIEPLFNPLWVFVFVGEEPSRWALLGGAIIVTTVAVHSIRQTLGRRNAQTAA
ncbi:MAG TPA: DMT family transporter [Pyrinomonadaceae bacterium]|nr:DMT family transporter [Pyrinomonadaceae bacterium]